MDDNNWKNLYDSLDDLLKTSKDAEKAISKISTDTTKNILGKYRTYKHKTERSLYIMRKNKMLALALAITAIICTFVSFILVLG